MKIAKLRKSLIKKASQGIRKSSRKVKRALVGNRYRKMAVRLAKLEAKVALVRAFKFTRFQLRIRPRIRLFVAILVILALAHLGSTRALAYLKPREAEIKVNGKAILVAEDTQAKAQDEVEITQAVNFKRSPFEYKKPVVNGQISQGYSSYHRAQDIATALGSPIKPLGAGRVEFAGYTSDGKGNIVMVDHGDNLKSLYAHMGKITVGVGDFVNTDTMVGTVGLTGRTTGPHVHLEVYDSEVMVDPASLLPE